MHIVSDLLSAWKINPQDIAHSDLSPHDRLDCLSTKEIHELGRIAAPRIVDCWDTPLGETLPRLLRYRSQPVTSTTLNVRSCNSLRRLGVVAWGDVAQFTPGQLYFNLRPISMPTVIDIVTCSIVQSLCSYQASNAAENRDTEDLDEELYEPPKGNPPETRLADLRKFGLADLRNFGIRGINVMNSLGTLRFLATWGIRERNAERLGDILELSSKSAPIPADLLVMWNKFAQFTLVDLADHVLLDITLDDLAKQLVRGMDERQCTVYRRRVIDGATLAVVSEELGITRERVRQLQQGSYGADPQCSTKRPLRSASLARRRSSIVSRYYCACRARHHTVGLEQESSRGKRRVGRMDASDYSPFGGTIPGARRLDDTQESQHPGSLGY